MKTIMVYRGGLPDAPSSELFEVDIDKEDLIPVSYTHLTLPTT